MQKFIEFIREHWDILASSAAGVTAWYYERNKRQLERRDSDVAFWEKTIDRQDKEINRLEGKMDQQHQQYEAKIRELLEQISILSGKLAAYERQHGAIETIPTIHTL